MSSSVSEHHVKGLAGGAHGNASVDVDWGVAYELILGLRMFVDRDEDRTTYAAGARWFDDVRGLVERAVLEAIDGYSGGHEILFGYLLALAAEAPDPRDAKALLETVEATSPTDLRRLQLGQRLRTYRGDVSFDLVASAADGDRGARRALLDRCEDWQRAPYEHVLSLEPDDAKRLLLRALEGWYEAVLQPAEREATRVLRRSARATRALARRLTLGELVDTVTRGIRYTPEPGIRRILLVPHVVSRPWTIFTEADDTKIVCYGVAEAHVTGNTPPNPLVATYKALGDETRLKILRRLAEGPATLHELTELLGLAKSTVHGHLLVLRTGGLVVTGSSKKTGYALRREALVESATTLDTYLDGTEE